MHCFLISDFGFIHSRNCREGWLTLDWREVVMQSSDRLADSSRETGRDWGGTGGFFSSWNFIRGFWEHSDSSTAEVRTSSIAHTILGHQTPVVKVAHADQTRVELFE